MIKKRKNERKGKETRMPDGGEQIKSSTVGETKQTEALGSDLSSPSGRTQENVHPLRAYLRPICHICHLILSSYDPYEVATAPPLCR